MFFLGPIEILIIVGCGIIFIKPADFPKIVNQTAQILAKIRRTQNLIKAEITDVTDNISDSINNIDHKSQSKPIDNSKTSSNANKDKLYLDT